MTKCVHDTKEKADAAYRRNRALLAARRIEDLIHLVDEPNIRAAMHNAILGLNGKS